MTQPVLSAVICPPAILTKTRNAKSMLATAEKNGWSAIATFAMGYDYPNEDVAVKSILVRASKGSDRVSALWSGQPEAESLGFDGAWHVSTKHKKIGWNDVLPILKGVERTPTARQEAERLKDVESMLEAIQVLAAVGSPISVLKTGSSTPSCQGKVKVGIYWVPCSKPADEGGVMCSGTCGPGLIAEL